MFNCSCRKFLSFILKTSILIEVIRSCVRSLLRLKYFASAFFAVDVSSWENVGFEGQRKHDGEQAFLAFMTVFRGRVDCDPSVTDALPTSHSGPCVLLFFWRVCIQVHAAPRSF